VHGFSHGVNLVRYIGGIHMSMLGAGLVAVEDVWTLFQLMYAFPSSILDCLCVVKFSDSHCFCHSHISEAKAKPTATATNFF